MSKVPSVFLSVLLLVSASAGAKTLYVDGATGNDATSYESNSGSSPWRTIGRAAWGSTSYDSPNATQAARAGDVVQIAAGVYWESGARDGNRGTVSLNPANSGTAAAPITFRGIGMVYVRMQAGYRGGMIGCNDRQHIIWDNFQIDDYYGGSTSDTGPVIFTWGARYCQIINSDIKGHPGSYYHGYPTFTGNYRGITLEPANNITIRNNRIHGFRGGQNEAGVMAYDSSDNIIENNEFYDNGTAVFIKGVHPPATQARNIIRRNVVRDNWSGIRVLSSVDAQVYQNIVYNHAETGIWVGFFDSTRTRVVNNTLYNNERGFVPQGTELVDVQFVGNIVASNRAAVFNWDSANPSGQDVSYDRNLYYQNDVHASYSPSIPFSTWQATYRHDVSGRTADPRFVNASAADFRLQSDSAARSLAIDILDLNNNGSSADAIPAGAYVTGNEVIGRFVSTSSVAPSAPTSVLVE